MTTIVDISEKFERMHEHSMLGTSRAASNAATLKNEILQAIKAGREQDHVELAVHLNSNHELLSILTQVREIAVETQLVAKVYIPVSVANNLPPSSVFVVDIDARTDAKKIMQIIRDHAAREELARNEHMGSYKPVVADEDDSTNLPKKNPKKRKIDITASGNKMPELRPLELKFLARLAEAAEKKKSNIIPIDQINKIGEEFGLKPMLVFEMLQRFAMRDYGITRILGERGIIRVLGNRERKQVFYLSENGRKKAAALKLN